MSIRISMNAIPAFSVMLPQFDFYTYIRTKVHKMQAKLVRVFKLMSCLRHRVEAVNITSIKIDDSLRCFQSQKQPLESYPFHESIHFTFDVK